MEGLRLAWKGRGFGNKLIMAHLVKICNDNGISTVLQNKSRIEGLVDVPMYSFENPKEEHQRYHLFSPIVTNTYKDKNCSEPVLVTYLRLISNYIGKELELDDSRHDHIPVVFNELPNIPAFDVVMCTQTGHWGPYREWPYFEVLKKMLSYSNISFVDMNKNKIFSNTCLNYVRKAKLYLGLETGMSHYVSKFANGKALILQSGFAPFDFWAYPYKYDYIKSIVPCSPCFINIQDISSGVACKRNNQCMAALTPERVFEAILKRL